MPDPVRNVRPDYQRRACLRSLLLVLAGGILPLPRVALAAAGSYPKTVDILYQARLQELTARNHYRAFIQQALKEDFPNIAYLFEAFATSEQIHAANFTRLLTDLNQPVQAPEFQIQVGSTRDNLKKAAGKEMAKITRVYPDFIEDLKPENYTAALDACHYAWQSHRQHEEQIRRIKKYSGWFFGQVAEHIEEQLFSFHVCDTCGSTINAKPELSCAICTLPAHHYHPINRPRS